MKAKRDELDLERANLKFKETKERDEPTRLKKYADALRGVIPKQTNEPVEVVAFFSQCGEIIFGLQGSKRTTGRDR